MNFIEDKRFIETLGHSRIVQEFEQAFNETTGLPLVLRPAESWQLAHHGRRNENRLCALLALRSRSCSACLDAQKRLSNNASHETRTIVCWAGLSDSAVPLKMGDRLIGFLQTGQAFRRTPTEPQFEEFWKVAKEWDLSIPREALRDAYFSGLVLSAKRYEAALRMLTIFGQHLTLVSNQLALQWENAEPPLVARAKAYILERQNERLSLGQVAKAVKTSTFYLCKVFKQSVGINFTDYLSRLRVEKAKNLLLNPNLRVSEIAFEVGFQSLTHFNRVFKKVTGQSPSEYRRQLPDPLQFRSGGNPTN